jgi:hypothetical protein
MLIMKMVPSEMDKAATGWCGFHIPAVQTLGSDCGLLMSKKDLNGNRL